MNSERLQEWLTQIMNYGPMVVLAVWGIILSFVEAVGNVSTSLIQTSILVSLTLIAFSFLSDKIFVVRETNRKLDRLLAGQPGHLLHTRSNYDIFEPLDKIGQDATSIQIAAWNGKGMLTAYESFLQQRIAAGCTVQVIFLNRHDNGLDNVLDTDDYNLLMAELQGMESVCRLFQTKVENLKGSFEFKVTDYAVPYTLQMIDRHSKRSGVLTVGLQPMDIDRPVSDRRYIRVDAIEAPDHFEYFAAQYDALWERSKTLEQAQPSVG